MLNNRVCISEAVRKGTHYPGAYQAIIAPAASDKVHAILIEALRKRAANTWAETPALLKGPFRQPDNTAFSPTHARKGGGFIVPISGNPR